ncbi:MAG: sugar phosphate nucleotidyltransferase [Chloroflexota bacterium]
MKAIVMAGGEGSRLRPLTVGRPKPMVSIVNQSVLAHTLALLKSHQLTEVFVTLRYMATAIQDFFEDGYNYGLQLRYSIEEIPLGTAGSVKKAAHRLQEPVLVVSGDALTDFNLTQIIEHHKASKAMATIVLTRVPNPLEYGVVVTDDDGFVKELLEKPSWGEVVSDTVNTGIYVLEPEVLELIPDDVSYDFSQNLFPLMLAQEIPINGCIADGYWCDIGNIDEYRRANSDLLAGKVNLPIPIGKHIGGGIWIGEDVEIAPNAQLFGPIYLGNHVRIKGDVMIYGPSVIRDYTIIDNYTRIERSIIWRNSYIGESCEIRGAVICRQCSIKAQAVAFEGVVMGEKCILGGGSVLHSNVKLWPRKEIEAGATIKDSIIWGNQGRRVLFNRFGVSGIVNVELTPEYAAKLGAALGATLQKGSYVAINRDTHRSSRMLKRALTSALAGAGIHVWDTESVAIPIVRYFVRTQEKATAGIHVRLSPFDQRVVDIRFMGADGVNLSKAAERNIERNFFREDFRRSYLDEIGQIQYAPDSIEQYTTHFLQKVDVERVRSARFKVVVDYSHGLAAYALADILNYLDVEVVPLNERADETKLAVLEDKFVANLEQASKIVRAVGADLGIQLDVGGEKMFVVDEKGGMLDNYTSAALMLELGLYAHPGRTVATPATAPNGFDLIAQWHESKMVRIHNSLRGLLAVSNAEDILLSVDGSGNFVFPDFLPVIDGMMATVRLLQYLAIRALTLSEVTTYLPPFHVAHRRIHCPWEAKGRVMRLLNDYHGGVKLEKIDGLKIYLPDAEWVHIAPSPEQPYFDARAEAGDPNRAAQLLDEYDDRISHLMEENG